MVPTYTVFIRWIVVYCSVIYQLACFIEQVAFGSTCGSECISQFIVLIFSIVPLVLLSLSILLHGSQRFRIGSVCFIGIQQYHANILAQGKFAYFFCAT